MLLKKIGGQDFFAVASSATARAPFSQYSAIPLRSSSGSGSGTTGTIKTVLLVEFQQSPETVMASISMEPIVDDHADPVPRTVAQGRWLSRVVLPDPRNPARTMTGICCLQGGDDRFSGGPSSGKRQGGGSGSGAASDRCSGPPGRMILLSAACSQDIGAPADHPRSAQNVGVNIARGTPASAP